MLKIFCLQIDQKNLAQQSDVTFEIILLHTHTQNDPAILRTLTAHHTLAFTLFTGTSQTP
jgi:hypothetical protein